MSRPEPLRTLPEQAFRARARLVALLLCGICFAGLIARLYWLQLAAGDWYTRRALGQQLRDTVVPSANHLRLPGWRNTADSGVSIQG